MNKEQLAEYKQMRQEILARAVMHHQHVVYAVALQFVGALFLIWLISSGAAWPSIELFLLAVPIVFAGLTFNYQANQATMESVASYLNAQYAEQGLGWEGFFGRRKAKQKLISFAKALPMIWPLTLPLWVWAFVGWPSSELGMGLMIVNLVFMLVTLLNFRYKVIK